MNILNFRSRILVKNILKGLLWLTGLIVLFYVFEEYTHFNLFLEHIAQWPWAVYSVFIASEVIFGIIPPEFFVKWSENHGLFDTYVANVALLAIISYGAGVLGYYIGSNLRNVAFFKPYFDRYIRRYRNLLNKYAGFLILIGAVTPVPFSAICMLVGATNFDFNKFLLVASSRFLRFAFYSAALFYI
ncbi:MAG: hypothetical protein RLO81_09365 [Fulvivirga sp.]|uniref:hypothetical protein n=1 Tax=Fulvivirga sp. TaxID=1931237 RepID=UPI0032EB7F9D